MTQSHKVTAAFVQYCFTELTTHQSSCPAGPFCSLPSGRSRSHHKIDQGEDQGRGCDLQIHNNISVHQCSETSEYGPFNSGIVDTLMASKCCIKRSSLFGLLCSLDILQDLYSCLHQRNRKTCDFQCCTASR